LVKAGLGSSADEYIRLKKSRVSKFMRTVTPWEVNHYLTFI